jgi:hypothetical protein
MALFHPCSANSAHFWSTTLIICLHKNVSNINKTFIYMIHGVKRKRTLVINPWYMKMKHRKAPTINPAENCQKVKRKELSRSDDCAPCSEPIMHLSCAPSCRTVGISTRSSSTPKQKHRSFFVVMSTQTFYTKSTTFDLLYFNSRIGARTHHNVCLKLFKSLTN